MLFTDTSLFIDLHVHMHTDTFTQKKADVDETFHNCFHVIK